MRTPVDFAHVASGAGAPIWLTIRHDGATRTITIAPAIMARRH